MNTENNDLLLRLLEGKLPDDEAKAVRQRLEESPELRQELADLRRLRATMRRTVDHTVAGSLRPLFSDRVMMRLADEPAARSAPAFMEEEIGFLSRFFRPVLAVGLFFAVALALYNVNIAGDYSMESSITESILGLPPVSTTSVYDLDLYSNSQASEQ